MYNSFVSLGFRSVIQQRVDGLLQEDFSPSVSVGFTFPRSFSQVWGYLRSLLRRVPTFYLLIFAGLFFVNPAESSFAAEASPQVFVASAYYSPLPNQEKYHLGSYEADIRMNGSGNRGADGTAVFEGMIAAPKEYKFGTKILLDGIGVVSVHDRGGAIKRVTEDNIILHDRIDIWMGYGDEGLRRTLSWGKREITGTIVDANTPVSLQLENIMQKAPTQMERALPKFAALGYTPYKGDIPAMIQKFQLEQQVISSADDPGAGHYGPKTQRKLALLYSKKGKNVVKNNIATSTTIIQNLPKMTRTEAKAFAESLRVPGIGKTTENVKNLQIFLTERGIYHGAQDGTMTKEVQDALKAYQISNKQRATGRMDVFTRKSIIEQMSKGEVAENNIKRLRFLLKRQLQPIQQ